MTTRDRNDGAVTGAVMHVIQALYSFSPVTRYGTPYVFDLLSWAVGLFTAAVLRYDFQLDEIGWRAIAIEFLVIALLQLVLGLVLHLYRGRHPYGSFDEVVTLVATVLPITVLVGGFVALFGNSWGQSRSIVFLASPIAFLLMGAVRYLKRMIVERSTRPDLSAARRTLIYGAGDLGGSLARRMLHDPASPYVPVGFIDDNPHKANVRRHGVGVLGTGEQLLEVVESTRAEVLVVAIGHADSELLRSIADAVAPSGVRVKVLPNLDQLLREGSRLGSLRDIEIQDLIGRAPVDTDVASIAEYVSGRRVLVTGAGGSIGSELAVQLARFAPAALVLLDRDESALQSTQIRLSGQGLLDSDDIVLADIRDAQALAEVFAVSRPEVVFHAAALKHLPLLERYPDEAWKTNVLGTVNVLEAARDAGVTTFVNISTDKAANPTSVLGHSKRMGEKLTAWAAQQTGLRYVSVRFGNVLGSRGSLIPTFQSLIEAGGPVTVTHPDATRFFMTIPEACQLVVQAGAIGRPGEVLVLDMGEPVRINDIAERMIEMSGKDIAIVYTGLRHGEKVHEELFGSKELDERPFHPKISHTFTGVISPENLDKTGWEARMRSEPRDNDTKLIEQVREVRDGAKLS